MSPAALLMLLSVLALGANMLVGPPKRRESGTGLHTLQHWLLWGAVAMGVTRSWVAPSVIMSIQIACLAAGAWLAAKAWTHRAHGRVH